LAIDVIARDWQEGVTKFTRESKMSQEKKLFESFLAAKIWAQKNAKECCFAFQSWMIQKSEGKFAVAIISKNSGELCGWAA